MPNGLAQINIEVADPAIQMGTALLAGMGQRVAWEVSTPLGFITTGVVAIGGLAASFFMEGLGKSALMGLANSGGSVAGWLLTEQFLLAPGAKGGVGSRTITRTELPGGGHEALGGGHALNGLSSQSISEMSRR